MLLEIVTRHLLTRPTALQRNRTSLAALTSDDWIQTILVDDAGRGVPWANMQLRTFEPIGDYVWVLDDDDECTMPDFVSGLSAIVRESAPDAIVVKMDHGPGLGILPGRQWQAQLSEGDCGCSAFITSKATWMAHRNAWGDRYAGDYDFVQAVQQNGATLYWWDVVASCIHGRNLGQPEKVTA